MTISGSSAAQVAAAVAIAGLGLAAVFVAAKRGAHPIVVSVALFSAGAAAIHFAAAGSHFREWWGFGVFFVASGAAQLAWALLLAVRSPSRAVWWGGVLGNAAIVLLWILTRTVGTLVGPEPHTPEAVGVPDAIASSLELAIVLAAVTYAGTRQPNRKLAWGVGGITFALTTLALLSIMGVATAVIPPME